MPAIRAEQVGPLYDILIATRDGSTLACPTIAGLTNGSNATVNLSQVAYVLSTTEASEEATEIQRKDQLTQLSSAQVIDRDFDAWPQVQQGDWSDGQGQRTFSGQGEAAGTVSNKATAYWDGFGILWPITDYLPQQPMLDNPDQGESGARMQFAGNGVASGVFGTLGVFGGVQARAFAYMQNSAPQHNIIMIRIPGNDYKIDPILGSTNGTPSTIANSRAIDYCFGFGLLWVITSAVGGVAPVRIDGYQPGTPPLSILNTTIANAQTCNSNTGVGSRIATGLVGNKQYLACTYFLTTDGFWHLRIYDLSSAGAFAGFTDVPLGTANSFSNPVQIAFQGDNLLLGMVSGQNAQVTSFNIPSQTFSTLANFENVNNVLFCPVGGGVFVLAANDVAVNNFPNTVDVYLLQGTSLQHYGPVTVAATAAGQSNVISGEVEPVPFGPYAVFGIYYFPVGGSGTRVAIFAYDVLRARLFKVQDIGSYDQFLGNVHGRRMSVSAPVSRNTPAGSLIAQWAIDVPVLSASGSASDISNVQGMIVQPSNGSFAPFIQQGVVVTSSLIDFTSSQNKLYRQVVASFTPLPNDSGISVQLDVWLDQDPAALSAVPDFTTGVFAGTGANIGKSQLNLVINKIARKLVYRITAIGPSTAKTPAVKLISVAIQVATGWSLHYFLSLAPQEVCNDGRTPVFQSQDGVDSLSAIVFLKNLWRLKGGQCQVTLPDGSSYPAQMQLLNSKSLKFIIANALSSDRTSSRQAVVEIRIREDV